MDACGGAEEEVGHGTKEEEKRRRRGAGIKEYEVVQKGKKKKRNFR
jgi:hypothetical protein